MLYRQWPMASSTHALKPRQMLNIFLNLAASREDQIIPRACEVRVGVKDVLDMWVCTTHKLSVLYY